MKIVFLDAKTVGETPNFEKLHQLGDLTLYPVTEPGQRVQRAEGAEVIITNKVVIDRELMEGLENLGMIAVAATGMNNIDIEAAEELGIEVKNVAGYSTHSVAQTTFAMLFQLMQNIPQYHTYVHGGEYSESALFTNADRNFHELKGKRIGIVGLGTIGSRVAAIADAFGAEVVYYSTSGQNLNRPYKHLDLDELLSTSDVVSIHAPLNENTENLISADQLKRMKRSAFLINTGRGGIVNERELASALQRGEIAGAALDVFQHEPLEADNPLLNVEDDNRLILTPHIAWSSVEARTELIEGIINNIRTYQQNKRG
jgi:lactate dehydrogenase-like 2-hydroxyacid dehydrogenase